MEPSAPKTIKPESAPAAAREAAIGLGYQFLAAMLFFVGGGYYIDRRRGGGVAFTLAGVGFALCYCVYEVWKLVRLLEKESGGPEKS